MKHIHLFGSLLLLILFLTLASTATATNVWFVDGVNGSDNNDCKSRQHACKTIGHAMSLASSGDSVEVAAATYKENLTFISSLKIFGSDASTTIIDGGGGNTVIAVLGLAQVVLSKLTIRNGSASYGGGIYNAGTLVISDCIVSGNTASGFDASGGGIYNVGRLSVGYSTVSGNNVSASQDSPYAEGGAISNYGDVALSDSTLSGNSVHGGRQSYAWGGGIVNVTGGVTINNSTFSANRVVGGHYGNFGGGIFNYVGTMKINNSTIAGNSAHSGGGGISTYLGAANLQNTIFANNTGGNCLHSLTSNGYNLSSDGTCNFKSTGDLNNTNPRLGPLQNNGGLTQTMALPSVSPAIDAGNPDGCTDGRGNLLKIDQRGYPRPDTEDASGCDMGAYESQSD
jgi:hypothetical protein